MQYATPELVVIGRAEVVVLGDIEGFLDHVDSLTRPPMGVTLGLDD